MRKVGAMGKKWEQSRRDMLRIAYALEKGADVDVDSIDKVTANGSFLRTCLYRIAC